MGQLVKAGLPSNLTYELLPKQPPTFLGVFHSSCQCCTVDVIIKSQWGERSPGFGNIFIKTRSRLTQHSMARSAHIVPRIN